MAQSRLIGDTYTFSATNFPDGVGVTQDPVTDEIIDHGTTPVSLTIDGVAEVAGGMRVNERIVDWPGVPGGIPAVQEAGIDGETEFDLVDWEVSGEIIEFSFESIDGEWIADSPNGQSAITLRNLDWANSEADSEPWFYETGFYFYWTVDGVPLTEYLTIEPDLGVLVGEHPFDPNIPEVAYIAYSRNQVEQATKPYSGGVDFTLGTTQLDEEQGSWNLLALVLSLPGLAEINGKPSNAFYMGILVDPPAEGAIVIEGDYNDNQLLDTGDLDLQAVAIAGGENPAEFDLNGDGIVDYDGDRMMWLHDLKKVYVGDVDLNGTFDSADFVTVFIAGKYETLEAATWEEGDWNADLVFDTGDFVAAFVDGGYEAGFFPGAVAAVPEPHGLLACGVAAGILFGNHRRRRNRSGGRCRTA